MIDSYGLAADEDRVRRIVMLRNDLVHESVWANGLPTNAADDFSFHASYWLQKLNARLFLAFLKVPADGIRSPWWAMGQYSLGLTFGDVAPQSSGEPEPTLPWGAR